jgi:hypothetical protein
MYDKWLSNDDHTTVVRQLTQHRLGKEYDHDVLLALIAKLVGDKAPLALDRVLAVVADDPRIPFWFSTIRSVTKKWKWLSPSRWSRLLQIHAAIKGGRAYDEVLLKGLLSELDIHLVDAVDELRMHNDIYRAIEAMRRRICQN